MVASMMLDDCCYAHTYMYMHCDDAHTHFHWRCFVPASSLLHPHLVSSPSEDKKSKKKKKKSKKSKKVKPEDEVDEDEVVPKKKSTFLCTFAPRSKPPFAAKHASSCTKTPHHPYHTECYCPRNCKEYNECMTDNHDLVLVSFAFLAVQCSASKRPHSLCYKC